MMESEQLSLIGVIPEIKVENEQEMAEICGALYRGGLPAAEIFVPAAGLDRIIEKVRRQAPEMILGAAGIQNAEQADCAIAAGASYIAAPVLDEALVRCCQQKDELLIFCAQNADDARAAAALGVKTIKLCRKEDLEALQTEDAAFLLAGCVSANNICAYLRLPQVAAVCGSWMIPEDAVKARDWDSVEKCAKETVEQILGLELKHVGINSGSPEQALADAERLCSLLGWQVRNGNKSIFAGSAFECMKLPFRGTHGHVAIGVNDVKRAMWHLQRRGFSFDESSAGYKDGKMNAIYLNEEIAGLAFHLLQK